MLKRDIETKINDWIKNDDRALLVYGVRQCGKTYIIRECLKNSSFNFVEFNLISDIEVLNILKETSNMDELFLKLSLYTDKKMIPYSTIIFFDEIQEYKEILTKVKFFSEYKKYKIILSGSLLKVKLNNIASAPVGYLNSIKMYPLSFREFLQLFNVSDEIFDLLKESFINHKEVDDSIHKRMMSLFNLYLIIGGMPDAVSKYQENQDIDDIMSIHLEIVKQYKIDFTKYESADKKLIISNIYDLIPSELNDSNKRFNIADINKNLRYERVSDSFVWLYKAGVCLPVFNVTEPIIPLRINEKHSLMKVFMSDVGMLTTIYGKGCKLKLLSNDKDINKGAIYENIVAQELSNKDIDLYYYNSKRLGEIDFLFEDNNGIVLIEVNSGKNYTRHSAINNMLKEYGGSISKAIVFSVDNVREEGRVIYLPLYMLMFLEKDIDLNIDISIDKYKF